MSIRRSVVALVVQKINNVNGKPYLECEAIEFDERQNLFECPNIDENCTEVYIIPAPTGCKMTFE